MTIPIIIISHNNHKYVANTIRQILYIRKELPTHIIVLDNNSIDKETVEYLRSIEGVPNIEVKYYPTNPGPWLNNQCHEDIYALLPDTFILTDPDLSFNEQLPSNFIEVLESLSNKYKCNKIGFALDISDFNDKMFQYTYFNNKNIQEWESQFWVDKLNDTDYELYKSYIDTTLYFTNKNYNNTLHIRVAGNFTAKHLPWYIDDTVMTHYERYIQYLQTNKYSTSKALFMKYINDTYSIIRKNSEQIIIENNNNDPNISFWKNIFSSWELDTFVVFDTYLNKDKIFIDIGGWIGTTCMYGSRKSKHVYVVEADQQSVTYLEKNCRNNATNITIIPNAIYHTSNNTILFGKNKHLQNSKTNDSTSQIYLDTDSINDVSSVYSVRTICIQDLLKQYDIDPLSISLIKIDIEGGEEFILQDLHILKQEYNIPMYVSFHYSWWNDKNLDRFSFLTNEYKQKIRADPFTSILL
jgi:FkbM family methyltransferase